MAEMVIRTQKCLTNSLESFIKVFILTTNEHNIHSSLSKLQIAHGIKWNIPVLIVSSPAPYGRQVVLLNPLDRIVGPVLALDQILHDRAKSTPSPQT